MSEYLFQQDVEAFQHLVFDLNTSSGVKKIPKLVIPIKLIHVNERATSLN